MNISKTALVDLGVHEGIINEGVTKYLDGKSKNWNWTSIGPNGDMIFQHDTLPPDIQAKVDWQVNNELKPISKEDFKIPGRCILDIVDSFKNGSQEFMHLYQHTSRPEYYGQKHAVLLTCTRIYIEEIKCKRGGKKNLFLTLRQLGIGYYSDLDSFRKVFTKLLDCKSFSAEIQHGATGKPNVARTIVTKWHKLKAMDLMAEGSLKNEILKRMNDSCRPGEKISYSTLKKVIDSKVENITKEDRYGYDIYKRDIEPYIRRKKPDYKLQVVEADGSRFQIPFYDPIRKKLRFLTLYVVIDVFSSMIVGFSTSESENTEMVLNAFWMMMAKQKYIPACVLVDNGLKNSEGWKEFQDETNRLFGTLWKKHLPDYPNSKGTVESFFKYFNVKYVRNYPNYLGLSIRAKSNDHRLQPEKVNKVNKNKKKVATYAETVFTCCRLISEWNRTITKSFSPEQKFNQGQIADARVVSEAEIARVCWTKLDEKRKVHRSHINFNNKEYELGNYDNINKYNGRKVEVYYHKSVTDYVFLFHEDQFIEKANVKPFFDEEDPLKFSKIKHNKALRDHNSMELKKAKSELEEIENTDPLFSTFFSNDKELENSEHERFIEEYLLNKNEIDLENETDEYEHESDLSSYE